jgi:hypothetical protein
MLPAVVDHIVNVHRTASGEAAPYGVRETTGREYQGKPECAIPKMQPRTRLLGLRQLLCGGSIGLPSTSTNVMSLNAPS